VYGKIRLDYNSFFLEWNDSPEPPQQPEFYTAYKEHLPIADIEKELENFRKRYPNYTIQRKGIGITISARLTEMQLLREMRALEARCGKPHLTEYLI